MGGRPRVPHRAHAHLAAARVPSQAAGAERLRARHIEACATGLMRELARQDEAFLELEARADVDAIALAEARAALASGTAESLRERFLDLEGGGSPEAITRPTGAPRGVGLRA
jgi:hypothetical protein